MIPADQPPLHPGLNSARQRAGWVLRIEQGWPTLLPALAALSAFAALALFALPQRLPLWLHVVVVLALAGFVASRFWLAGHRLMPPAGPAIDRRIEQRSGLQHRPLQTLLDRPAGLDRPSGTTPDPVQEAVWQAHRERTRAGLDRLRAGPPRLGWRGQASGRLTLALVPVLLLALVVAGADSPRRLAAGFLPGLFTPPGPAPWMQAWITPPDYARAAPVFLTALHGETTVPFGSVLQVSLTGLRGEPELVTRDLDAAHHASALAFRRLSEGSWSLAGTLDSGIGLSLRGNGRRLADWTIHVTPLPATLVAWDGAPGAAGNHAPSQASGEPWRTRLPWHVAHPYGLNTLTAEIGLVDTKVSIPPLHVPIPLAPGTRDARGVALPDLSADPRAGEAVVARLSATDVSGHVTESPEARFTLPARVFRNPLATAVIETRKRIALGREDRSEGASDLEALGQAPGPFASDAGMFLNLSSIAALLANNDVDDGPAIDEASGRLWELALALEDGLHNDHDGARAVADVRAARESVAAQLDRMRQLGDKGQSNKEQSELERRIQALSQAIARRMQALAEQAQHDHTVLPPMPDMKTLSGGDLARMMQQMREEAAHGNTQDAMKRLAQMQSMLDRMRNATPQDLQSLQQQAEAQQQVREQMAGLKDLVGRQSALLDQTQSRRGAEAKENASPAQAGGMDRQTAELMRRLGIPQAGDEGAPPSADEMPPGSQPGDIPQGDGSNDPADSSAPSPSGSPAATPAEQARRRASAQARQAQQRRDTRVQHSLARALDELGREFKALSGKQPGGFDDARKAMNQAREALAAGHDQPAQDAQQQALADLQKGGKQMQQALSSGSGGATVLMPGMAGESGGSRPGEGQDQDEAGDNTPGGPRDPLGRQAATGSHADDGDTHVPDKAEQMRARDIEQELRRRDTDRTRSPDELNYLDRLLKPF